MRALPLSLDLPAEPGSAATARHAVAAALREWPVDHAAVALVVSEAVANVVVHAYRGRRRPGRVRVTLELLPESVELVIEDDGIGMQPRTDSPGAGLGLPLIAGLADRLEVASGDGTRLTASFGLGRTGVAQADAAPAT